MRRSGVTMADKARDRLMTIRMSADERARLDALAAHLGVPASNVVRMLVKRESDAIGYAAKTRGKESAKR